MVESSSSYIIYALYMSFIVYVLKGMYNNSHTLSIPVDLHEIPYVFYISHP